MTEGEENCRTSQRVRCERDLTRVKQTRSPEKMAIRPFRVLPADFIDVSRNRPVSLIPLGENAQKKLRRGIVLAPCHAIFF
jgi:hypothetical protein